MDAEELELIESDARENRRKRIRLIAGISCVSLIVFCCCGSCGLFALGATRHARDVNAFSPAPVTDPSAETDPGWRAIASARQSASEQTCEGVLGPLEASLSAMSRDELIAMHAWVRARLADADTQGLRDACGAAFQGGCTPPMFLSFRAALVLMGQKSFIDAIAEPDSLATTLEPYPQCERLTWVVLTALRAAQSADAGTDASESEGEPPPILDDTRTQQHTRYELRTRVPALCARYSCGIQDVFDEAP